MAASQTQFGRYRIIAPLGAGGMGEVYRAHDPQLRRDVAIKILPSLRSSDPEFIARMVRESQMAAAVDHPGVIAIHDVGEQEGQFYLVSELVEGETLRERIRRGVMPVREAVEVACAVASALAAAHARGVVHRDLKPENVMIAAASGAVKVLDFGVAKFVAPPDAATEVPDTVLTAAGATVGTPAYMSPEQLEGREIDHRADQFAFGVVLHEMLSGQRPFGGHTAAELSASILRDQPGSLTGLRPDTPVPLARLVARCLSKHPEQRFASTIDLAHAIDDIRADFDVLSTPAPAVARRNPLPWRIATAAAAIAVVAAIVIGWPRAREQPPVTGAVTHAIAVLPFTSLGDSAAYLADGITEAVTRELGHIKGTRVIASNSAFAYRGRSDAPAEVGRELGVDVLVRGSIQRDGERLRISASLVSVADAATLWSQHYDRGAADILAVQDDIAWQVAARLATALGAEPPPRPDNTPKTTPEAYDAFLRGLIHLRGPSSGFVDAITELERAVALDPNFALAHARLASAYTQQFFYNASDPELESKAFVEIQKALAVNPDLAEAYLARSQLRWNLRNGFPHEPAIADLRRALENNPNLSEAHIELGKLYLHLGLIDKSIAANEQALRLEPRSAAATQRLVGAWIDGGRHATVVDALARNPRWSLRARSTALSFLGRTDEAVAAIVPGGADPQQLKKVEMNEVALLAQLFARQGRRADAERTLAVAIPLSANPTGLSDTHHAQFAIGCAYALLGDAEKALEWLTKAANEGYPSYSRFSTEADLAVLKTDPRFDALLRRLRKDFERWQETL